MIKKPVAIILTDTHNDTDHHEIVEDLYEQCFALARKLSVKHIFHAGDFFNNRTGQSLSTLLSQKRIFERVEEYGLDLIGIAGNHDKSDLESEKSYLSLYDRYTDVYFCENETTTDITSIPQFTFHFLPYFKENGSMLERLQNLNKRLNSKTKNILIMHGAIDGVSNNKVIKVENEVKVGLFSGFHKVFVGHYHNKSFIKPNIYYIGSVRAANFGEDNNKGFTVLYDDGSHELIVAKFPQYVKEVIDFAEIDEDTIMNLKLKIADSPDKIRVVIKGTKEELETAKIQEFLNLGVDVKKETRTELKGEIFEETDNISYDEKSISELFHDYCQENFITGKNKVNGLKLLKVLR